MIQKSTIGLIFLSGLIIGLIIYFATKKKKSDISYPPFQGPCTPNPNGLGSLGCYCGDPPPAYGKTLPPTNWDTVMTNCGIGHTGRGMNDSQFAGKNSCQVAWTDKNGVSHLGRPCANKSICYKVDQQPLPPPGQSMQSAIKWQNKKCHPDVDDTILNKPSPNPLCNWNGCFATHGPRHKHTSKPPSNLPSKPTFYSPDQYS
jgi:hypothetical protein